ncbi:TonB family protein [Rhodobacteraceae bacterium KMM 6894]|nr:TonB family protein [Rhodobacteraceae bacterium KMM 6894]
MRRTAEFTLFLILAVGLHLAIAGLGAKSEGAQSAGQGGAAVMSLQAASAQVSAMVERWDTPPKAEDAAPPAMPDAALSPDTAPPLRAMNDPTPIALQSAPGLPVPHSDAVPRQTDTTPAPVPVPPVSPAELARMAEVRPQIRPEDLMRAPAPAKPAAQKKAKKPAQQKSASSAAQQASGAGGGTNAGTARNTGAATASPGQIQSLFAQWGAQVRQKIERAKRYPASGRGASGTVQVRITVGRNGSLRGVSVTRSSGNTALDKAAVQAVKSARRFPSAPRQLSEPSYTFTLAMKFST